MGELSAMSDNRMYVHWSIDGVTKNDYRENVDLEKVWQNFHTYYHAGGKCIWQYINFDYNEKISGDFKDLPIEVGAN